MSKLHWPTTGAVPEVDVRSDDACCVGCGQRGTVEDVRRRKLRSREGRVLLRVPVRECNDPSCLQFRKRVGAEVEMAIAPPHWTVTWDLFAWMGHRRFSRHWSVPQIRHEVHDQFSLDVSDDWVEDYLRRFQIIVAGRESDIERLREEYAAYRRRHPERSTGCNQRRGMRRSTSCASCVWDVCGSANRCSPVRPRRCVGSSIGQRGWPRP